MAAAGIQMASTTDMTLARISPAVANTAARPANRNSPEISTAVRANTPGQNAGPGRGKPDPGHRRRTLVRQTSRVGELAEAIFGPVIRGTLSQAAAYPDATLASIAEFLSAHRALLYSYLTTVSQGGSADIVKPASARADP